ncbi:MAG: GNAT family N-acetyltransferase [Enterobacterales bacterium]|nr:GNAT family N-acetyltransferase [Enterobacterales bacterium]
MTDKIDWQWYLFEQLKPNQMAAMLALRQEVFVVEQNCPYLDIDGKDPQAMHLIGWQNQTIIATLRLFESYPDYDNHVSIGRICTAQSVRGKGVGQQLMDQVIDYIKQNFPSKKIQIGAQYYLKPFYTSFGFKQISEIYLEDGIEHILMIKQP